MNKYVSFIIPNVGTSPYHKDTPEIEVIILDPPNQQEAEYIYLMWLVLEAPRNEITFHEVLKWHPYKKDKIQQLLGITDSGWERLYSGDKHIQPAMWTLLMLKIIEKYRLPIEDFDISCRKRSSTRRSYTVTYAHDFNLKGV